jgi:NADPH-dependent 2,4-dienoyl-CoA reductase/sulfur reductase-like enzyme
VDHVVAGIGIQPNTELAETIGLVVDDGIRVAEDLQTDEADIFAAGDVAAFPSHIGNGRRRVEHEDNALTMGRVAGRNMAGKPEILEFTQAKTSRHLIYLKNSGILTHRRYNHWVYYQLKDEVYEIINQIFQFLKRDQQLVHDQQLYQTLFSNRELAINKMKMEGWQKVTVDEK